MGFAAVQTLKKNSCYCQARLSVSEGQDPPVRGFKPCTGHQVEVKISLRSERNGASHLKSPHNTPHDSLLFFMSVFRPPMT